MWKKVLQMKSVYVFIIMISLVLGNGVIVSAQKVQEEEPNGTWETAQLIQANRETLADTVNAVPKPNQYAVDGYTDKNDEDWYKVYLQSGVQYVSLNADAPLDFEVYDANHMLVMRESYQKVAFGVNAYEFHASAGYYYIKIVGVETLPKYYVLMAGEPNTMVSTCKVNLRTVTMSNKRNQIVDFNLSDETQLPDNAIVYEIRTEGLRSTSVNNVAVTNRTTGSRVNMRPYTWSQTGLLAMNMPLKSNWSIEFTYYKNTSFTPTVTLFYAYPVVTHVVDEITVTP